MSINMNVDGNGNIVAGRDLNIFEISFKLNFNDEHLKEVIEGLSKLELGKDTDKKGKDVSLYRPNIEEKNEKNKLTEDYFIYMNNTFLPYFEKIKTFLSNTLNEPFKEKYIEVTKDINFYIMTQKSSIPNFHFEIVFSELMNIIDKKFSNSLNSKIKNLYKIIFHFMYWNCDIGENV